MTKNRVRNRSGTISEFGAGLIILVVFVVIPLLDFVVIPIRWMLAQEIVSNYARTLSMCETLSQSYKFLEADPSLRTRLIRLGGVSVNNIDMHLRISRVTRSGGEGEFASVTQPGQIPSSWLPDAGNSKKVYSLELETYCSMSPALLLPGFSLSIPGLTAPIPLKIEASHKWGNLGINPATGRYFINE